MGEDLRAALRAELRRRRDAINPFERARRSQAVCETLASNIGETLRGSAGRGQGRALPVVALYRAMGSELTLDRLVKLLADRVQLVAPVTMTKGRLAFVEVAPTELVVEKPGCMREPAAFLAQPWRSVEQVPEGRRVVPPDAVRLAVVPGLGFDTRGGRLGYGGGYYDRYLGQPSWHGVCWGVCFTEQLCERVPAEPHDIPMDSVWVG